MQTITTFAVSTKKKNSKYLSGNAHGLGLGG